MENELIFDAPIPGENYTSDTKNYPWHRPPEITDYDTAIEFAMTGLMDEDTSVTYMTLLESGVDVVTATDIFVTLGIGAGQWTPDMAVLIAGPVSRILEIMAKHHGIDFKLGTEVSPPRVTAAYLNAIRQEAEMGAEGAPEEELVPMPTQPEMSGAMGGLGAPAPKDEQDAMLGYGPEEEMPMPEEEQGAM